MPRKLAEHGTWAAYKRHKRANEQACAPCQEAAREHSRKQREKAAAARAAFAPENIERIEVATQTRLDKKAPDGYTIVNQLVAYGHVQEVPVPTFEDAVESARWRLHRVRSALIVANPRDVAALAKAEQETIEELTRLTAAAKPEGESALDMLAKKRQERIEAAARAAQEG